MGFLARQLDPPISAKTLDHPILARGLDRPSSGVGPQVLSIYSFAETHPSQGWCPEFLVGWIWMITPMAWAAVKPELFKLVTVPSDAWNIPALNTSSLHEWYRSGHQWLSNDAAWLQSMLKQVYTVCWLKMYHLKRGNLFLTNKMGLRGPQWCLWNPKWVLNWTREHKIDPTWRPRNPKWSPANPKTDPTWNLQHYFFRVQNGMTFGRENFYFETSKVQRGSMPLKPKKGSKMYM